MSGLSPDEQIRELAVYVSEHFTDAIAPNARVCDVVKSLLEQHRQDPETQKRLRPLEEVQWAHDLLGNHIQGVFSNPDLDDSDVCELMTALGAICWVLQHNHQNPFSTWLEKLSRDLARH